jgi:D-alanyl-lipoteichoic acid acyltransferase DltB (MBOAT superfamily)
VTFNLTLIAIFVVGGWGYSLILPKAWRGWALFIASVMAVYALQPPLRIRYMDFIFPSVTLLLTVVVWVLTAPRPEGKFKWSRADIQTLLLIVIMMLALPLFRFIPAEYNVITASRPPEQGNIIIALVGFLVVMLGLSIFTTASRQRRVLSIVILVIVGIFILLKTESIALAISQWLRTQTEHDPTVANPLTDLNWLGFSYVAFRLIHVLRDRQTGNLPDISLRDMITYIVFFPSLTAGPIDRVERFTEDIKALREMNGRDPSRLVEGSARIVIGIFKKFVVADSLALFALSIGNVEQVTTASMMWVLLYTYAFRLFFDFSGYSDIAIGIGILFGVRLPENFNRPYLKNNITAFWQSWHITLSNWVRFYIFSPLTRSMLRWKRKPSSNSIVLIGLITTMVTIGLWHGINPAFFFWGLWHAIGLFVHKIWSDRTRKWYNQFKKKEGQLRLWNLAGTVLTFHFVVLGWVWFALPNIRVGLIVFGRLFGLGF